MGAGTRLALWDPGLRGKDAEARSQNMCIYKSRKSGCRLSNETAWVSMGSLVGMFKLSNTTFGN